MSDYLPRLSVNDPLDASVIAASLSLSMPLLAIEDRERATALYKACLDELERMDVSAPNLVALTRERDPYDASHTR